MNIGIWKKVTQCAPATGSRYEVYTPPKKNKTDAERDRKTPATRKAPEPVLLTHTGFLTLDGIRRPHAILNAIKAKK